MLATSLKTWDTTRSDQNHDNLPITMRANRVLQKPQIALQSRPNSLGMSRAQDCIELSPVLEQSMAASPAYLPRDIGSRFGVRLRDLRRSHRLTQLDMAVSFGIDRSYISDVECGKKGISLATLEVIALGFSMKLSDLLEDL
jgi:DNA-binding XRE family transcriptional regulator